jgi:N-acyl-D-aspartate/D-glutamate deacylase
MLCDLSKNAGRINQYRYSTEEIIQKLSREPNVLYMTDAWIEKKGVQNPAAYDCFPKFLKRALEGRGESMPLAIRKMSGAVADRFMLADRGYLRPGCYADVTVFDEAALRAGKPNLFDAFGVTGVFINGKEVLKDSIAQEQALRFAGKAMRAGR